MSDPQSPEVAALIGNRTMDIVVSAIVFMVGAVVVFEAWRLGSRWTDDGPGSGYFPFYIGLIVCVSALGVMLQTALGKAGDGGAFVNREQLARVASVIVPAVAYVLGIVFLGIYVASAIYIALFMTLLGRYAPAKGVSLGVAVAAVFFLMFEVWFKVPLYKGSLDLLGFLGY